MTVTIEYNHGFTTKKELIEEIIYEDAVQYIISINVVACEDIHDIKTKYTCISKMYFKIIPEDERFKIVDGRSLLYGYVKTREEFAEYITPLVIHETEFLIRVNKDRGITYFKDYDDAKEYFIQDFKENIKNNNITSVAELNWFYQQLLEADYLDDEHIAIGSAFLLSE